MDEAQTGEGWRARPVLAAGLGLVMLVVPVLVGVVTSWVVGRAVPAAWGTAAWWALVLAAAVGGAVLAERAVRRLAPLRSLLRATLTFPGRPPSRLVLAARRASTEQLLTRLEEAKVDAVAARDVDAVTRVLILVTALQAHDPRTRGHAERVRMFMDLLSAEMGLPAVDRGQLRWAALLHDIGKIQVPTAVLNKPSALDEDDWATIRRHPARGMDLCQPLLPWLGEHGGGIGQHHERWDGEGYPAGLAGEEIALAARMVAVVDAYEVMTAPRAYKASMPAVAAREELARQAGTQFDPAVVRAFLALSVRRLGMATGLSAAVLATLPARAQSAGMAASVLSAGVISLGVLTGVGPGPTAVPGAGAPATGVPQGQDVAGAAGAAAADAGAATGVPQGGDPATGPPPPPPGTADAPTGGATPRPVPTAADAAGGQPADQASPAPAPAAAAERPGATSAVDPPRAPARPLPSLDAPDTPAPPPPAPAPPPAPTPGPTPGGRFVREPAAPAGSPPRAVDDAFAVVRDSSHVLDVLANDDDVDGDLDPSTLTIVAGPQHGSATVRPDAQIALETQPGYTGEDELVYEICDEAGGCARATVRLTVTGD